LFTFFNHLKTANYKTDVENTRKCEGKADTQPMNTSVRFCCFVLLPLEVGAVLPTLCKIFRQQFCKKVVTKKFQVSSSCKKVC
jgi:hypothetical protein